MKKWKLLPKLAWTGVMKNGAVYFPYIGAGIFSVFTYFIFTSIVHNDLIATLPNSSYAWMLLQIGKGLLTLILVPFLYYANGFLIKRRKKEIGLYHILGLEKKHIGSMMLFEAIILYAAVMFGGIVSGALLCKFLFLLLLRMTGLPVEAEFVFYKEAFTETAVVFFWIYIINLSANLWEVGKSRAAELLSGSRRGEKEPKILWLYAVLGVVILAWGYVCAIRSKVDSMIFMNFFLAVFLVVVGTYLLFTSGSVAFLKILKKNKKTYYKPSNFITISGMLYRMKKNAASLVNICIFSTMVIITLICTSSLYLGLNDISDFDYPYDADVYFQGVKIDDMEIDNKISALSKKYNIKNVEKISYDEINLLCGKEGNKFRESFPREQRQDNYGIKILTLSDYNKMENKAEVLEADEAMILSTGEDFAHDTVSITGKEFKIKKELTDVYAFPKSVKNKFLQNFYVIVKDKSVMEECIRTWAAISGVEDVNGYIDSVGTTVSLKPEGEENEKDKFVKDFIEWCALQPGYTASADNMDGRAMNASMNGGLLFIGILFSLIFLMCLILIMYYKQISEGYEDKEGFVIMQKVGMSDKEIKNTIHRQIMLVFFLPLAGSILHTAAGLFMVDKLIATLRLYNTSLIIGCSIAAVVVFALIYGVSYMMTAKTYYRIVKQREL